MKKTLALFVLLCIAGPGLVAQQYHYADVTGNPGFSLRSSDVSSVSIRFAVPTFTMDDVTAEGATMRHISIPGSFLPGEEGMPDLPGSGRYIAIPTGAIPRVQILSMKQEVLHNIDIAPAPRIPTDHQPDFPLQKNRTAYSANAFFPESPVKLSEVQNIRGVDVVILGITPFQYNPVTRELIVYKELEVQVTFEGGNGQFGDPAYRSRWWDPIMEDQILNNGSLPVIDYDKRVETRTNAPATNECEYIIISPTGPEFLAWADTIRKFRSQQGILTRIFTLTEVGGNTVNAIESFINNAYNGWTIKPVACLLLADYGSDATKNIITQLYNDHPDGYNPYASDNKYADVNGDEMPDVVFSRILANNESQLQVLITKFLDNERNPTSDPLFYDKPISALGWQTERWFQLCAEIVGGYFRNHLGKHPRRINAIYDGSPGSIWSSASNTSTIVNYFGPNGLGYIPATPAVLGGWSGGNATKINNAIDSGAFMLVHRDHGSYSGWGEPDYSSSNIAQLDNTALPFVFSINCQTGAYHKSADCFAEKFIRHTKNGHNAGALGMVCPSEVSYSFVNDTFVWGMFDNMFPDFMPLYGTTPPSRGVLPAFGNAAAKYFLKLSNWPGGASSVKTVTYRLFHMLGEAFQTVYTEVPQPLTVVHDTVIAYGSLLFPIRADANALIALTVNDEIIATATGTGAPVDITLPQLEVGVNVLVTVTKQNYYRYSANVPVISTALEAKFKSNATEICSGSVVDYTDLSTGNPVAWSWVFEGATPSASNQRNPSGIVYDLTGSHDVTLTVYDATGDSMTLVKPGYIAVDAIPLADFADITGCKGVPVNFTDLSGANGGTITAWLWNFSDPSSGVANTSTDQNPSHVFTNPGTYNVSLKVTRNGACTDITQKPIVINAIPLNAATPQGATTLCRGTETATYTTPGAMWATSFSWLVTPPEAGAITGTGVTATLALTPDFTGNLTIKVQGINSCGTGIYSLELPVTVLEKPDAGFADAAGCSGQPVQFTDASVSNGTTITGWSWDFGDPGSGTANTATGQNPAHTFSAPGSFQVSLMVTSNGNCTDTEVKTVVIGDVPAMAGTPQGETALCKDAAGISYTTTELTGVTGYEWSVDPFQAATVNGSGAAVTLSATPGFTGAFTIKVRGFNTCGNGVISDGLTVAVNGAPEAPARPSGPARVDVNITGQSEFTVTDVAGAESYAWTLAPESAGTIAGNGTTAAASWNTTFRGQANVNLKAIGSCGESGISEAQNVEIYSSLGISENGNLSISVFPNPGDGQFSLDITSGRSSALTLRVYNALGAMVYSESGVKFNGTVRKTIDLSSLANGVYHLRIEGEGLPRSIRLVKE